MGNAFCAYRPARAQADRGAPHGDIGQSIERLIEIEPYQYPGYHYRGSLELAQLNLETMLSNRRAVKLLHELERLPERDRDLKCQEMFAKTFRTHLLVNRALLAREDERKPFWSAIRRDATKLALCAVMFATAKHGKLETLAEEFAQLDAFKEELERRIAERRPPYEPVMISVLRGWSAPDYRFQVNVLRVAASRAPGDPSRLLRQIDELMAVAKKEVAIVPWNARFTWFDREGPMDTRQGVTKHAFVDWKDSQTQVDPEIQRRLLRRIRKLVLGEPEGAASIRAD